MNWAWIALSCCQATGTWTEDGAGIGMGIEMGMGIGIRIGNGNRELWKFFEWWGHDGHSSDS